jgi:hypothetical protein
MLNAHPEVELAIWRAVMIFDAHTSHKGKPPLHCVSVHFALDFVNLVFWFSNMSAIFRGPLIFLGVDDNRGAGLQSFAD